MTHEELKTRLLSYCQFYDGNSIDERFPIGKTEKDMIDWIMEVLQNRPYEINFDKIEAAKTTGKVIMREILYVVAYGTPNIPLALRKKKPFLFNDDMEEFYSWNDNPWESYRLSHTPKLQGQDYMVYTPH